MREFKFRAWTHNPENKKLGEMLYNVYPINNLHHAIRCEEADFETMKGTIILFGGVPKFMQYTESKDKNGKDIYEGDIIKFQIGYYKAKRNQNVKDVVIFKDSCFKTKKFQMPISALINAEIIGNIYENPELIKGE